MKEFDENPIYYVYAHYRPNDDVPFYVGKGSERRCFYKRNRNPLWKNIADKYGFEVRFFLENLKEYDALCMEALYINAYGRRDLGKGPLSNMTDGGEGQSGWVPSSEWREQKRQLMTGNTYSLGRKHPIEEIEYRSSKLRGIKKSPCKPETREKMRIAQTGKTRSPQMREKTRIRMIGNTYAKGKASKKSPRTKEHNENQRRVQTGMKHKPRTKEHSEYIKNLRWCFDTDGINHRIPVTENLPMGWKWGRNKKCL